MATHTNHDQKESFYFITLTCFKWLNLFDLTQIYDYLPFWFQKLKDNGCPLCGYVIMPNHMHFIIYANNSVINLNKLIAESKRFLAYEIVKRLKARNEINILQILQNGVQANEIAKGKRHQVFRLSFDAKSVDEVEVANILDYIHHNPVSGKWNLVADYSQYTFSSAGYYENGDSPKFGLVDYRNVFDLCSESSSSDSEQ